MNSYEPEEIKAKLIESGKFSEEEIEKITKVDEAIMEPGSLEPNLPQTKPKTTPRPTPLPQPTDRPTNKPTPLPKPKKKPQPKPTPLPQPKRTVVSPTPDGGYSVGEALGTALAIGGAVGTAIGGGALIRKAVDAGKKLKQKTRERTGLNLLDK